MTPEITPWVIAVRGSIDGSRERMKKKTPVMTPDRDTGRENTLGRGLSSRSLVLMRWRIWVTDGDDNPGSRANQSDPTWCRQSALASEPPNRQE